MKITFLKHILVLASAAGLFLAGAPLAHATVIVAAPSITASPGTFGNFDVTLSNTGPSAIQIAGFAFSITTTNSAITFTAVSISTAAPYVFAGHSLFGPTIDLGPGTTSTLEATDNYDIPNANVTIASGTTVGLGHISYSIASTATLGNFAITLGAFPVTSLSDALGNNVTINKLIPGSISIVPEPGTMLLFPAALGMMFMLRQKNFGVR